MSDEISVPFNDLTRIHFPLLEQFKEKLTDLVESSHLVLGGEVSNFEAELAIAEDCKFAVGVNSGTSAIELALRALDIGPGDEVITTAFTFIATTFSILQVGATPVLVDIDPLTGLLDPQGIERAITSKTKAVVYVTLHGRVEGLIQLQTICKKNQLFFVIDAAQSHLGTFAGKSQSTFCDVATLSFYPGKNLGALGEGGAILTNSQEINNRVLLMRDWGASEKYNHTVWGGNFRLESLQAAFLRIKLRKLKEWTTERIRIAGIYRDQINKDLLTNPLPEGSSHVYHIFSIQVHDRGNFADRLLKSKIGFGFHYPKAIQQQPAYKPLVKSIGPLNNSEWLADRTISLPLFPHQREYEIERVIEIVNRHSSSST